MKTIKISAAAFLALTSVLMFGPQSVFGASIMPINDIKITPGASITLSLVFNTVIGDGFSVLDYSTLTQSESLVTYSDSIGSQFLIANPGSSLTIVDAAEITLTAAPPLGTEIDDDLTIYYDQYSVSPTAANFDPIADYKRSGSTGAHIQFNVSAPSVGTGTPTPTPEGPTAVLTLSGVALALLGTVARKQREAS